MRHYLCPPLHGCCRLTYWLWCLLGRCGRRTLLHPPLQAHGHCLMTDNPEREHYTPLVWSNRVRLSDQNLAYFINKSIERNWRRCVCVLVCCHLRLEVLLGCVFGFCRSWQSLSLMLIVSSGASRHTKIQLGDKSIQALKIKHFISASVLRKLSANTFSNSFPLPARTEDDINLSAALILVHTWLSLLLELWFWILVTYTGLFLTCLLTQRSNACSRW